MRDPFTFGPRQSVGAVETDAAPDDQCPRGLAAIDGDVCVLAVVRWKGQQVAWNVNVSTFANGKALRTGRATDGSLVVRVPPNSDVYALASHRVDGDLLVVSIYRDSGELLARDREITSLERKSQFLAVALIVLALP